MTQEITTTTQAWEAFDIFFKELDDYMRLDEYVQVEISELSMPAKCHLYGFIQAQIEKARKETP